MKCLIAFVFQFYVALSFLWCFIRSLPLYVDLSEMEDHESMPSGYFLLPLVSGYTTQSIWAVLLYSIVSRIVICTIFYFCETCLPFHCSRFESEYKETILKLFCNVNVASDNRDSDWPIDTELSTLWTVQSDWSSIRIRQSAIFLRKNIAKNAKIARFGLTN